MPVLDSFSVAFQNKETWERVDEGWRKGVEYIHSQLMSVLKENSLIEINPHDGEQFNPLYHVVAETIITDKKEDEGKILKVSQKGYRTGEIVIRPARVVVFECKE